MDIRSFFESRWFKCTKFQSYEKYLKNERIPDGDRTIITPENITIGNMPWQEGWNKNYVEGEDPMFRDNLPYDQQGASSDNITITQDEIIMTKPKEAESKDAYLYSNFTIKYGTVRALLKTPNVDGIWSAFWLFGTDGMPEHDMIEHCGQWKNETACTHHWGYDYNGVKGKKSTLWNGRKNKKFKPSEDFNLYEVELGPYKTVYRLNGKIIRTMKHSLSSGLNRIIFDVTKGSYCGTDPKQAVDADGVMSVKSIEIFKIH